MSTDHRSAAQTTITQLITVLQSTPGGAASSLISECESLSRAIAAFHMEGIRFRMYSVDRLVTRHRSTLPDAVPGLLEETRKHLESAGFHTRSHQAPI
jgi:hypothetical protein